MEPQRMVELLRTVKEDLLAGNSNLERVMAAFQSCIMQLSEDTQMRSFETGARLPVVRLELSQAHRALQRALASASRNELREITPHVNEAIGLLQHCSHPRREG